MTTSRDTSFSEAVLAEADAFAKVRAEALRRGYGSLNEDRRQAFMELAEFCDKQEKSTLNGGRRSRASSGSRNRVRGDEGQ